MLFTCDTECGGFSAGRDHYVARGQDIASGVAFQSQRCGPFETHATVKGRDPRLGITLFPILRNRIGKCAFESHERRPIDSGVALRRAFALHSLGPVHQLRRADEYFFRIAAAQCTGTPKGS